MAKRSNVPSPPLESTRQSAPALSISLFPLPQLSDSYAETAEQGETEERYGEGGVRERESR